MMPPSFRSAGLFDAPLLAELHRLCFTEGWDQPWSEKSFSDVLAMPGAASLIASDADAPLAFGLTLQAADEVELLLLGTLPSARGKGLGHALLDRLMGDAAARGARRAFLEVA
ncbi:GNAT family N-acetyltransferase, partial [Dongia sp.]|uniref:GNAT family N-acetyltransferase n=1 Tax=Dongia sp. TaxID=1977262 RepID=UPI0035B096EE